jgi:hypothetical protein
MDLAQDHFQWCAYEEAMLSLDVLLPYIYWDILMVKFLARCVLLNGEDGGEIGISGDGPSGSATSQ